MKSDNDRINAINDAKRALRKAIALYSKEACSSNDLNRVEALMEYALNALNNIKEEN